MAQYVHPELRNLADEKAVKSFGDKARMGDEDARSLATMVQEDFKSDEESCKEWQKKHAEWLKLYYQQDPPKNPPWEGASTESIPMLAEACNQFHARAYQAMFPNNDIIRARPVGKSDSAAKERAERISKHMSWQLMVRDRRYRKNKSRLLLQVPLHGSVFTKTYFDPISKRNVTENVRSTDLIVPYGTGPRDVEDLERKTHVIPLPMHKAAYLTESGFFLSMPEPWWDDTQTEQQKVHDKAHGVQPPGYQEKREACILEQHGFWDIDDDGLPEPYIVWYDRATEKVLRVAIRYDTDEAGNPTNRKMPVEYFTHFTFLENPDGFYGLGYGHLLGPINTAVNKLVRQGIDAATLANVGNASGFISQALAGKKGELQMQLGKFKPVPHSGDEIQRGIFQFKFPGPNPTLFNVLDLLMMKGDRLATVTEAITGQTEKVMQPTTILALIEQSLQVFSASQEGIIDSWSSELEKHFRLNGKYLDPVEYFTLLDIPGTVQEFTASREDYKENLQVVPTADPKMSTERQKLAKAEAEWVHVSTNQLILTSPIHYRNASRRYLEAIGSEDIDEVLPNVLENQLPRVDDPRQENMGALSPVPMVPAAFPDQDHQMHIQEHAMFLNDPDYGKQISQEGRVAMQQHIQAHVAFMYGMTESDSGEFGPDRLVAQARDAGVPIGSPESVPGEAGAQPKLVGGNVPVQGPPGGAGMGGGVA